MQAVAADPSLAHTCVVVPTYNERENVARLARALRAVDPALRVLFVDDGSPDGTAAAAREAAASLAPMEVLERPAKAGRGSACRAGFARALEDPATRFVVEMDADFSHEPAELPRLVDALENADVVVGSRYLPGSRVSGCSLWRRALSRAANALARRALAVRLSDYTNGLRAYRREAAETLVAESLRSPGYIALSEAAARLHARGFRFAEVPTTFVDRRAGKSKADWRELAQAARGLLRLARRAG